MAAFETALKAHSRTQLEIKNWYPISRSDRVHYTVNAYIFTPGQLELDGDRYGVDHFFSDVKSHTRFSIAYIPLKRLVDPECTVSPLYRIRRFLRETVMPGDLDQARILYELRTLANLYSAQVKASYRLIRDTLNKGDEAAVTEKTERFLKEIDQFLTNTRELHTRFLDPAVTEELRTALRWSDEYISISTDKVLYYLHSLFKQQKLAKQIEKGLRGEVEYRHSMGYPCVLQSGKSGEVEGLLYRENILKKWSQTVLYMSSEETGTNRKIGHILAGVAAAAAMSFAVAATFYANRLFASYSIPWALIIVVSYILKDRIKEILRGILVRVMPRFIADRTEKLTDQAVGRTVGTSRSMVRFLRPGETPRTVRAMRDSGANPFRSILPQENVIHFRKTIRLNSRKLLKEHTRIEAITEIMRLKLDRFMLEMDASRKYLRTWSEEGLQSVKGKRVYHVNLIIALADEIDDEEKLFRYRLILNSQGLQRIEEVLTMQN